jgi:peptidoglycan biosynthesis protein MviN/MurJ (putative lipid II flippase)
LHTTLIASGSSRGALQAGVFQGVVSVLLYCAAIPLLGYSGAVLGLVVGNVAVNPLYVYLLRRRGVRVTVAEYVKPVSLLAAVIVGSLWLDSGVGLLLFAMIPFGLASLLFGCLTVADLQSFWRALPSPVVSASGAAK